MPGVIETCAGAVVNNAWLLLVATAIVTLAPAASVIATLAVPSPMPATVNELPVTLAVATVVLLLVAPRLLARWLGAAPRIEDPQSRWLDLAARAGHTVLYAFLIALPLSGWYAASRLGVPVSFLGIDLPNLTGSVQGAPGEIADLHETGGTLILWLAGLHALIALWHQFVLKDWTLERMNPMAPSDLTGDRR